jgi:hypothetical protein
MDALEIISELAAKRSSELPFEMLVEILSLPSLSIKQIDLLPKNPSIYFVCWQTNILYIGSCISLYYRWRGRHHKIEILEKCWPNASINYIEIERGQRSKIQKQELVIQEQEWIELFKPPLNGQAGRLFTNSLDLIDSEDSVSLFVDYCLRPCGNAQPLLSRHLHELYKIFCLAFNYKFIGRNKFLSLVRSYLWHSRRCGKTTKDESIPTHWIGIGLAPGVFNYSGDEIYCERFNCQRGGIESFKLRDEQIRQRRL